MEVLVNDVEYKNLLEENDNLTDLVKFQKNEIGKLNNIIDETTKYVKSLSSSGRGCDIYEDIKKEILNKLKGETK